MRELLLSSKGRAAKAARRWPGALKTRPGNACRSCAGEAAAAKTIRAPPGPCLPPGSKAAIPRKRQRGFAGDSGSFLLPFGFQQLAEALEFLRVNAVILQDVEDQGLMGVLEEAADQVADFEAGGLLASYQRHIDVGAPVFDVLHVAFLFQDPDSGEDGVISQRRLGRQGLQQLMDGARPLLPKQIHEPQLSFRQGWGCSRRHLFLPLLFLLDAG